jgi:hypothetical protein
VIFILLFLILRTQKIMPMLIYKKFSKTIQDYVKL